MPLAVAVRRGLKADSPAEPKWESQVWPLICFHLEAPKTKTRAPEPPAGRFPKFLLPRAAGSTQKLKCTLSILSPTPVRVVGGEWKSLGSRWNQDFQVLHMWLRRPGSANRRQGRRKNCRKLTPEYFYRIAHRGIYAVKPVRIARGPIIGGKKIPEGLNFGVYMGKTLKLRGADFFTT